MEFWVAFISSWFVSYIYAWQHPTVTVCSDPSSNLLYPFPALLAIRSHFSPYHSPVHPPNPVFQLHHFQAPRILYYSLPHIPTFIASSSILRIQNSTFFTLPTFLPCASKPALFISSFLPHYSMQKCRYQYRDSCCRDFCWCLWELAAAVPEREDHRFRNTLLKDKKLLCISCSKTVTPVHISSSWQARDGLSLCKSISHLL